LRQMCRIDAVQLFESGRKTLTGATITIRIAVI